MHIIKNSPTLPSTNRPLRTHAGLLRLVEKPQFERLPEVAKKEVERELMYRRAEGRAA